MLSATPQDEHFTALVQRALAVTQQVLGTELACCLPADSPHSWADKYSLAESALSSAASLTLASLELLGVTPAHLATLQGWARSGDAVALRFTCSTRCRLARSAQREVPGPRTLTRSVLGLFSSATAATSSVTDHFHAFSHGWALEAVRGAGRGEGAALPLAARLAMGEGEVMAPSPVPPFPSIVLPPLEVDVSWLLGQVEEGEGALRARVRVDRAHAQCFTPRRNKDAEAALNFFTQLAFWASQLQACVAEHIQRPDAAAHPDAQPRAGVLSADSLFVPALVLLARQPHGAPEAEAAPPTLSLASAAALCGEALAGLQAARASLAAELPPAASPRLFTSGEGALVLTLAYLQRLATQARGAVDHLEALVHEQVSAAVGRVLAPADFAACMAHRCRSLFRPDFAPRPLCFSVRRSALHCPEGTLSLREAGASPGDCIHALCAPAHCAPGAHMTMALSADAQATARQFSSFILCVGRIASPSAFEPAAAVIVRDRDELSLPLSLAELPTPKEFKDAVASLSPEQQRFCRALRDMQLQSTLFGVLVLQVRPALERLLRLAPDALTREVALTRDLQQLLVEYHVPPDLLSASEGEGEGACGAPGCARLAEVKAHVASMQTAIKAQQEADLAEERRKAELEIVRRRALEMEAFINQEKEFSVICSGIPQRISTLVNFESNNTERNEEKGMKRVRAIRTDLAQAKQLIQDMEMSNRTIAEPTKRDVAKKISVHRETIKTLEKDLALAEQFDRGALHDAGALFDAHRRMEETIDVGLETLGQLESNRFKLLRIRGNVPVEGVSGVLLDTARRLLRGVSRPVKVELQSVQDNMLDKMAASLTSLHESCAAPPAEVASEPPGVGGVGGKEAGGGSAGAGLPQGLPQAQQLDARPQGQGAPRPAAATAAAASRDLTKVPGELDAAYERSDTGGSALRAAILSLSGEPWVRRRLPSILSREPTVTELDGEAQGAGRREAFGLLDVLTRSGALPLEHAALHVVMGAVHSFEQSLVDTVCRENVNPIERVEGSLLAQASVLNLLPPSSLVFLEHRSVG